MSEGRRAVRAAVATFVAGAGLLAAILAVTLSDSAPVRTVRIGAPGLKAINELGGQSLGRTSSEPVLCQAGEVLPSGVSAIRVSIWGFYGAHIHLMVYRGTQLLTQGSRAADWTGSAVTVPVRPLSRTVGGVRVCFAIGPNSEPLNLLGNETPARQSAVAFLTRDLPSRTSLASTARPSSAASSTEVGRPSV